MAASWHDPPGRELIDRYPLPSRSLKNDDIVEETIALDTSEDDIFHADDSDDEKYFSGMKVGLKHLYSGTEDKKGRFQWQDTIPRDLEHPVENEETAKWALVVRKIKIYNDPSKLLRMHSLVIQSPLLKALLAKVLKGYPGITVGLDRFEFSGKFEPIIHRWAELQDAIDALGSEQIAEKQHAALLQSVLVEEFKDLIDISQDMKTKRVMTFEYLWTLFQPGTTIFALPDGQEAASILVNTRYGEDTNGVTCFEISYKNVDWDGARFGTSTSRMAISWFDGTCPITSLKAYPLEYHKNPEAVRVRLIERGAKMEGLAGSNYRAYEGIAWKLNAEREKIKYNVKSRIVIDTYEWNRLSGDYAIHVSALEPKKAGNDAVYSGGDEVPVEDNDYEHGYTNEDFIVRDPHDNYDGADNGSTHDDTFVEEDKCSRAPLTEEQKLICSPLLRGYSLKNKLWLNFFVSSVKDIEWQKDAFNRLVLPKDQKELILGFTQSQREHRDTFDDVIKGKGRGMIILLCGPPGVGKTLTAESVAEEMKVPLYSMSASDIGFEPRQLERTLQEIFEMCSRWNAVLLLDEADVFLEQRSMHDLQRNKLVSIFLRVLEYYEGTMILTTNRVATFDPAFHSRIHISLDYQELSTVSRRTIWENFLKANEPDHTIDKGQLTKLAGMNLNGRQIKNLLKTSRLLALHKKETLGYAHIATAFDITQHLHKETQATEHTRGSLYG